MTLTDLRPAAPVVSDRSGKSAINAFNVWMRQQPWYIDWHRQQGLDPNHVKLSKGQRNQLEQVAIRNGVPANTFQDLMIDPASNLNTEHGFASQPTWLKALEIGGAAAGGYFAAPYVGSALGHLGGSGSTSSFGLLDTAPGVMPASTYAGPLAKAGGYGLAQVFATPAINAATGIYGARTQAKSAREALTAQSAAANRAADLEAQAAAEQLAFLKEQDRLNREETRLADEKNYGIYLEERNYGRQNFADREARMTPYRTMGQQSLAQLMRPPGRVMTGADLMRPR